MIALASGGAAPAAAGNPTNSSVSAFINCPNSISFAIPSGTGSCPWGDFTGVYTGVAQTVASSQDSVLYLASANGQIRVNYTLTDVTSGKLLLKWLASGTISGGTCASPSAILPESPGPGTPYYVISSGAVINPGDTLKVHLIWTSLSGTGTPTFCSGGSKASLVSIGTTAITGATQPLLATELKAGVPHQAVVGNYTGEAETFVNTGASLNAQVLGVLKDSSGRTVDVLVSSIIASPNVNVTAFLVFKNYPAGSYTLTVFAVTSTNVPVSLPTVATVVV